MSVGKFITKNILSGHYRPEERKKIPQSKINMRRYFMSYAGEVIITARNEVGTRLCFYTCLRFCSQGGGWGCLPHTPLWADTPPARHPLGRHPRQTLPPPLPGQTTPFADTSRADSPGQTPPSPAMLRYAQQVGGTHPTGMQFCILYRSKDNLFHLFESIDAGQNLRKICRI